MRMFFPEFLQIGASEAHAVKLLQFWLLFAGFNDQITINGTFFAATYVGVKRLQEVLGFSRDGIDGKFGPNTRRVLLEMRNLDVNALPADLFEMDKLLHQGQLFFPENVELLSKDRVAMKLLQTALLFTGCNDAIIADGIDGEQTALGMKNLQRDLGFNEILRTGKFDNKTRAALYAQRGLDVSRISADMFDVKTTARVEMQA